MSKISIIIPIYNVEKYIVKCVNSVLQQTYAHLDIILVNDGSTDNSGLICNQFAKQDSRVNVIHKQNGGLSDARNVGLDKAIGDYIFYLDGDDYIVSDCISLLYDAAQKYNAEVVQSNFYYAYPNYLLYNDTLKGKGKVFSREAAMYALLEQKIIKNFAWGKLYKKDTVELNSFKKGVFFEDSFWQHKVIDKTKKYVIIPDNLYYYNQRENSISAKFTIKNIDLLTGTFERLIFIKEEYPKLYPLAVNQFEKLFFQYLIMARKTHKNEYKTIFELIRENPLKANYKFKSKFQYYIFFNLSLCIPIVDVVQRIRNKLFLNKTYYKKIQIKND